MDKEYVSAKMLHRDMGIKWEFNAWFDSKIRSLGLEQRSAEEDLFYERRNIDSTGGAKGTLIILTESSAKKIVRSCRKENYRIPDKLLREYQSFLQTITIRDIAAIFEMSIPELKKIYFSMDKSITSCDRWYENRLVKSDRDNIELAIKKMKNNGISIA